MKLFLFMKNFSKDSQFLKLKFELYLYASK